MPTSLVSPTAVAQRPHIGMPAGAQHKTPLQPAPEPMDDALPENLPEFDAASGQPSTSLSNPSLLEKDASCYTSLYLEMRTALTDFEHQQQQLIATPAVTGIRRSTRMPPRQTAFYAALRSALQQVVAETSPSAQHARLAAAHAWFVSHRPRLAPGDPMLASALAASLSLNSLSQQQQPHPSLAGSHTGPEPTQQSDAPLTAAVDAPGGSGPSTRNNDSSPWPVQGAAASSAPGACDCADSAELARAELHTAEAACSHLPGPTAGSRTPSSVHHAVKLEAAARHAFQASWEAHAGSSREGDNLVLGVRAHCSQAAGSRDLCSATCTRGNSCSRGVLQSSPGNVAADLPGLIPVGCLPSSRVYITVSGDSMTVGTSEAAQQSRAVRRGTSGSKAQGGWGGGREGVRVAPTAQQQQQQWRQFQDRQAAWECVVSQQAALEADVASSMRGFARQQARIEEEISKRQESVAVSAAAAAVAAAAAGACDPAQPRCGRTLRHVDSQHQRSQIAVELTSLSGVAHGASSGFAAAAGLPSQGNTNNGCSVQLVVPDRVKAARKQHQQHELQECKMLQEKLGISDQRLAHALLPPPDVPYMSAFAQLPSFCPPAKTTAAKTSQGAAKGGRSNRKKASKQGSNKGANAAKSGKVKA